MITLIAFALLALLVALAVVGGFTSWAKRASRGRPVAAAPMGPDWIGRMLPEEPGRASVVAVVVAALIGIALVLIGISGMFLSRYGWTVFVITPFAVGYIAAALSSYRQEPTLWRCVRAGTFAVLTAGLGFLVMGAEGAICLLMAIPITVPCAIVGALVAFVAHTRRQPMPGTLGMIVLVVPIGLAAEPALLQTPPAHVIRSTIDIAAAPEEVWAHLIEFEPIAAPLESWLFRAGVAYPISATLQGRGVGAVRVCDFSTGRFIETIRVWDEGKRLMFTVDEAPPPLEEWTPYEGVHPPHLKGYFVAESADFRLIPLEGGGTRLEGTSVYRNHMWPGAYWDLWSHAIVSSVHRRVFEHVRQLAEKNASS